MLTAELFLLPFSSVYHQKWNRPSFQDLSHQGFGANYWWDRFAAVHNNLAIWRSKKGYFNEKTQGVAHLFKNRCVTDIATLNERANTIHINAKLRMTICDKVNTKTPLKFIETKRNKKSKISIHQLHGKI